MRVQRPAPAQVRGVAVLHEGRLLHRPTRIMTYDARYDDGTVVTGLELVDVVVPWHTTDAYDLKAQVEAVTPREGIGEWITPWGAYRRPTTPDAS